MKSLLFPAVVCSFLVPAASLAESFPCSPTGTACNARIPDYAGSVATSTLTVASTCSNSRLEQVRVGVKVAHDQVGDLNIKLRAPSGQEVTLINGLGRSAQKGGCPGDDLDATFAPGGAMPTCGNLAPSLSGTLNPVDALGMLVGGPRSGTWTLTLADLENGHGGSLVDWSLDLPCGLPVVTLTVVDAEARENAQDTATFRVGRSGDTTAALTVGLTVMGTATSATDYTALPAQVTIAAGASTADITVTGLADAVAEPPESIILALGEGAFVAGQPSSATAWIVGMESTSTVTATPNPSKRGQAVAFTAAVSGAGAMATGTVEFLVDGTVTGSAALSAGQAVWSTSALEQGGHLVVAHYLGDTVYAPSVSSAFQQLVGVDSATVLAVTPNPAVAGALVSMTATVTSVGGAPQGSVTFKDGDAVLGSADLVAGVATYTSSSLAPGMHSLTATHNAPGSPATMPSTPVVLVVTPAPTTTTLTAAKTTVEAAESVQLLAVVGSALADAGGVVTFKEGTTSLGFATLSAGNGVLSLGGLAAGTHSIVASYGGDGTHAASVSAALDITVNAAASSSGPTDSNGTNTCGCSASNTSGQGAGWSGLGMLLAGLLVAARRRR